MNTPESDINQWEAFRNGDKEAFAFLFRSYYELLFRFGEKFTPDKELLEDCIQELFIELWQAHSKAPVLSVKAYLLKSLKYKLLKAFRKNGRSVAFTENAKSSFTSPLGHQFEWSHDIFLIREEDARQKRQRVLAALDRLSHRQKEIIYLKYYQNLSYEEVSEIMNINYQVARNLLYQAMKSLKAILLNSMELFLAVL